MEFKDALKHNEAGWNAVADQYFGVTALPAYGPFAPTEEELNLFGRVNGKKVLELGCGSGHSLCYMGSKGAEELWGLDISSEQINTASSLLREKGYGAKLFVSPMEENPGIPLGHFDIVYSIYALGWSIDIEKTIRLAASYLKSGGTFIFSWDHPFMQSVLAKDGRLTVERSYHDEGLININIRKNQPMVLRNWKLSTYINTLAACGMKIEQLYESVNDEVLENHAEFSERYYSAFRGKRMPLTFIIKATKL